MSDSAAGLRVIILPRGGGKTERLLEWLQEPHEGEHRILVSHSREESHRVMRLAFDRGLMRDVLASWQFVSVSEVVGGDAWDAFKAFHPGTIVLGIDNADLSLHHLLGYPIAALTVTA